MRIKLIILSIWFIAPLLTAAEKDIFQWKAFEDKKIYAPLGEVIPTNTYSTQNGKIELPTIVAGKPFIIAVRDPDCPVSRKYSADLKKLQSSNLNIIYLLTSNFANIETAQKDMVRHNLYGNYLLDVDGQLSKWLGVHTSSEVYLFDEESRLRYRGAIDDRFGIGFKNPIANKEFLNNALDSVTAGLKVEVPVTSAPGCIVNTKVAVDSPNEATWYKQVSRLMTSKCQLCHRPGQAGPFPLETYEQIVQRKAMIKFVLEKNIMPPWSNIEDSERLVSDRHLSKIDRQLLIDWIEAGAPKGNVEDAAPPHIWSSGWKYGEPDVVLTSPVELSIPAEGEVSYKYVSIPTDFNEDKWVQTIEVATKTPQNTHHIIVFVLPPEPTQDRFFPGMSGKTISRKQMHMLALRGFFSGYVPGLPGIRYKEDTAKILPKGWRIVLQIHHQTDGQATKDRPSVGLQFSKQRPNKIVETLAATDIDLRIPARKSKHLETAEYKFTTNGQIIGLYPHMHLRGSAFRYELIHHNGVKETLLNVPNYDPNWQFYYQLDEAIEVKAGSILFASGWFDNSKENKNNPNPNTEVRFGLRTRDEMLIGYFDWIEVLEKKLISSN